MPGHSHYTTDGCDQKHVTKRARTAWLSEGAKAHLVIGVREISIHDIRALLVAVGTSDALIVSMIDRREDKGQDVPLLIKLLTELAKLAPRGGTCNRHNGHLNSAYA